MRWGKAAGRMAELLKWGVGQAWRGAACWKGCDCCGGGGSCGTAGRPARTARCKGCASCGCGAGGATCQMAWCCPLEGRCLLLLWLLLLWRLHHQPDVKNLHGDLL